MNQAKPGLTKIDQPAGCREINRGPWLFTREMFTGCKCCSVVLLLLVVSVVVLSYGDKSGFGVVQNRVGRVGANTK